jgi:hypothetical protein
MEGGQHKQTELKEGKPINSSNYAANNVLT